ncbi:MAG TPA: radical SAM protein [Armatimonadetes bacterium]|nr:radical SAM protein [Armatimonadota bacterium]
MTQPSAQSYLFGPVPSRRLGRSLGVDVVPYKTCPFDCIYCQLGPTTRKTIVRREYVPTAEVCAQLRARLAGKPAWDYVTFSGSGEPTLHAHLGRMIATAKELTSTPVAVLTNGALFSQPDLREEVAAADLIIPSLDAATPATFARVNRPHPALRLETILGGLRRLREEFAGEVWLEIMLVRGLNDPPAEIEALVAAVSYLQPHKVQLNTVVRPPAENFAQPLTRTELEQVAAAFTPPAEVIADLPLEVETLPAGTAVEEGILSLLSRRPCTLEDVATSLHLHPAEALKYLNDLLKGGAIREVRHGEKRFFVRGEG